MIILSLLFIIFFSKLAFRFIPGVPYEFNPLVFQYGIHPYINIVVTFILGFVLFVKPGLLKRHQLRRYHFYLLVFCGYLFLITVLQILLDNSTDQNALFAVMSSVLSVFMIVLFGLKIPQSFEAEKTVSFLYKLTASLCWFSVFIYLVMPSIGYMGGRFIGVFKHIPHMVSVATLCGFFSLYSIFNSKEKTKAQLIWGYAHLVLALYLLILTGTRSALASVLMGIVLSLIVFKTRHVAIKFLKTSLAVGLLLTGFFFGADIADYAIQVATGEKSIGQRAAQDGLSSRWDEVQRGFNEFSEKPLLGHGLLSKFSSANEDNQVGAYDASKDPHNILISAGVIGGYGFIFLVSIGFIGLIILSLNRLFGSSDAIKIIAIYMTTQIPILFIYHMHLSMGGIADRIYWLFIGYLALKDKNK